MATPIDVVVFKCRKIFPAGNRWNREIEISQKKQNFGSLSSCRYCVDRQSPTFGSQFFKFHRNRFIFGGVIAERVKAVLLAHRVFAIFAFGRINGIKNKNWQKQFPLDLSRFAWWRAMKSEKLNFMYIMLNVVFGCWQFSPILHFRDAVRWRTL